jgi:hypothetical protein
MINRHERRRRIAKMRHDQTPVKAYVLDGTPQGGWGNGPYNEYKAPDKMPSGVRLLGRGVAVLANYGGCDVTCAAQVVVGTLEAIDNGFSPYLHRVEFEGYGGV